MNQAIPFLIVATLLTTFGQITMHRGMNIKKRGSSLKNTVLHALRTPLVWVGTISLASAMLFWLRVLSHMEISLAYPIFFGGCMVSVFLSSVLFLKETIKIQQIVGAILISLGIVVASLEI